MGHLKTIEHGVRSLENRISPQTLFNDNHLARALNNRTEWRKAKEAGNGQMTLYIVCGDARIVTTEMFQGPNIVSISSIASSGDLMPFVNLLQSNYVGQIIVVGHFDHEKINETGEIKGCGGVDTSQKLKAGQVAIGQEDLGHFLKQRVTPEFFENVNKTVENAALISGKPVLGVLSDHLTYGAFPIIEQIGGQQIKLAYNYLKKFQKGQIGDLKDFLTIGSNIFPELKLEDLEPVFRKIIQNNRRKSSKRLDKNPGFIERQRVQNPSTVVVSTCPMPVALRYTETFGQPNQAFVVRQPFLKVGDGMNYSLEGMDFESIVGQIYYPISHAIKNEPKHGFSDTKDLLIETPDLELSAHIANRLLKIDFIKEWIAKRGARILIGEVKKEETTQLQFLSGE